MADTKVSALPAVTTPAGTDEFPVNQGGTSKKMTLTEINAYTEPVSAANTAVVGPGFAADTYLTGSGITVVPARLQAGSFYRLRFNITKTAAGVAAPVFTLRMGTLGTTGDAAIVALTFGAQTAVVDSGDFEFFANFRSVGSGTAAVVAAYARLSHGLTTTGLSSASTNAYQTNTSAGFNSSAVTKIGLSVNAGASAAWTIQVVQADLLNIA